MRCWFSPAGCMNMHSYGRQPGEFNCVSFVEETAYWSSAHAVCMLAAPLHSWVSATLHVTYNAHALTAETPLLQGQGSAML